MRKKIFGMLGALFAAALCAAAFTACNVGTGGDSGNTGGEITEEPTTGGSDTTVEETTTYGIDTQYDVTYYIISTDQSTAAEGETVTVTVKPMSNVTITAVYYNDTECDNGSADESGNYTCTFEMPAATVTITADATMSVTFTYDNKSNYSADNIYIMTMDNVLGASSWKTIYLSNFDSNKGYSFEYVIGHTYNVSCNYSADGTTTTLYFSNWTGTNTGDATNTLTRNENYSHYTLTLETPGIEVKFTITNS